MVNISPSNGGGKGLIPGQRTKISHASWPKKKPDDKPGPTVYSTGNFTQYFVITCKAEESEKYIVYVLYI